MEPLQTFTCPACGLLCDDITPSNNTCAKSVAFFGQDAGNESAKIHGKEVALAEAISHAAQLLKKSQKPTFAGLSTDIAGFKSLNNLAQKNNARMQHMNAQSLARNMKVLQNSGWQTTTLTEVKNRADVIVCFGDIAAHNPRFFERFVDCDGMFVIAKNRQILMLENAENNVHLKTDALKGLCSKPFRASDLPSVTIALRALVSGKALKASEIAGVKVSDLQIIADKLKAAKYAVLVWVAKDFDFPHAELAIQNITETVAILNQTTRAAGLPLGGSDGDTSVNYAHSWLNGAVLDSGVVAKPDLQIWVNSFNADAPPSFCHTPTIVLGNANTPWNEHADVFIPVATPGLDCAGAMVRVDGAVTLPLKKVRANSLPTLAEVVSQIEAELT